MDNKTIKEYDEIIATIMHNIIIEQHINGRIILWDFNESQDMDRLYANVAAIVADMNHEPIYVDMPFFDYLKLKKKMPKRKNLYYMNWFLKRRYPTEERTSIYLIMECVREYHKIPIEKFKEINDEFYGWIE